MNDNKRRRKSSRVVIAFAAGPPAAAAVTTMLFLLLGLAFEDDGEVLPLILGALFVGLLVLGYFVSMILGIPGYLLFRRMGWLARRHCFLLGAAIGILCGACFALTGLGRADGPDSQAWNIILASVFIAIVLAGVMGLVFALVIRPRRLNIDEVASTFD